MEVFLILNSEVTFERICGFFRGAMGFLVYIDGRVGRVGVLIGTKSGMVRAALFLNSAISRKMLRGDGM